MKGQIIAAAEEAITAILVGESAHPTSELAEIETLLLKIRKRWGERITV